MSRNTEERHRISLIGAKKVLSVEMPFEWSLEASVGELHINRTKNLS